GWATGGSADEDAAREARIGDEQVRHQSTAALEHAEVPAGAGAVAGDDLVVAVAGQVHRPDAHAAAEARRVGQEVRQQRLGGGDRLDLRHPSRALAGDDLVGAVAVEVGPGDEDAPGEAPEGEETADQRPRAAVERLDVPAGRAGTGADDDVVEAAAVDAAPADGDAARESGEGEEGVQPRPRLAGEDLDVPAGRAGPGADDDVGGAIVVDVA